MCAGIEQYLLHSGIGQEFKGIINQEGIGDRKKTLFGIKSFRKPRARERQYKAMTYPWFLKCERFKSRFKYISNHLRGMVSYLLTSI